MKHTAGADPCTPAARVGATILPHLRVGGPIPSRAYLERFPPAGVMAFGRSRSDGETLPGLEGEIEALRSGCLERGHPEPFFCCDLEEGAGLHFEGGTRLPPALCLAAAEAGQRGRREAGPDWILSAAALTALEARHFGVQLVLAPVVDVNTRRDNPIIAVRSFGDRVGAVVRRAATYVEGLHLGGAGACLKHYPGHGDTESDSHDVLPLVPRVIEQLEEVELAPYRALFDPREPVEAVMVAHLDVPALTGRAGLATSLSRRAVAEVLCGRHALPDARGTAPLDDRPAPLHYAGTVLSDGIDMGAVAGLERVHSRALYAGCHGLLCPADSERAALEILAGAADPELSERATWLHVEHATRSMRALRERLLARSPVTAGAPLVELHAGARPSAGPRERRAFATELAAAGLCVAPRGDREAWPWRRGQPFELRRPFREDGEAERSLATELGALGAPPDPALPLVLVVSCRVSAGRGRAGLLPEQEHELREELEAARRGGRAVGLCWFGSPQLLPRGLWEGGVPGLLVAFAPSPPLVRAVAGFLRGERVAGGSLPVRLG